MISADDPPGRCDGFWCALGLMAIFLAAGCGEAPEAPKAAPPRVTVQHPEERELVDYDRYNGWTAASETLEVRSRVRGHIKKVHFTDGEIVKKGDLLFELDPRPFQADVERAKEQLNVTKAQLDFATAEESRNQQLYDRKAITKAELDKAVAEKKTWVAKVEAAQEEVTRADLELEYSRITSDISGRIGRALLTEGNLVNAGGSDPLLTTVVTVNPINIYFAVDERSLLKFRQRQALRKGEQSPPSAPADKLPETSADGDSAEEGSGANAASEGETKATEPSTSEKRAARLNEVKDAKIPFEFGFEIEKGYPHQGVLDFGDNRINPETGTIEVRGTAPNKDGAYVPGARVRVQIPISDKYKAIVIPDTAILSDQDQRYVLIVNDENVVIRRTVTLGRLLPDGGRVILPSKEKHQGLTPNDLVITVGLQRARINYPVEPVDDDGKPVAQHK